MNQGHLVRDGAGREGPLDVLEAVKLFDIGGPRLHLGNLKQHAQLAWVVVARPAMGLELRLLDTDPVQAGQVFNRREPAE